jgi:hypothetical protein
MIEKQLSPKKSRARQPRSDKGKPQLTRRSLDLLRQIGEGTSYRFDQVQGLAARHPDTYSENPEFLSETRTRAIIRQWQRLGLVEYRKILHDEPGWIWLTRKGLYHVKLSARFHEPSLADLEHLYWINETRALIEDTYGSAPGFTWESERQIRTTREHLRAQQKKQGEGLWIPYEYRGTHRPDALLRYRTSEEPDAPEIVSAIEVELSEKPYKTWKKIFLELAKYYTTAQYYVDPTVKASLLRALETFQNEPPAYGEPDSESRQYIYVRDLEERL